MAEPGSHCAGRRRGMRNEPRAGEHGRHCYGFRDLDQYFGRWEMAHLRACSIGPYGASAARKRRTVGSASMRSRQAEKTG